MLGMCIAVRLIVPPIVAAAHTGPIDAVAEACGSIKWADFVFYCGQLLWACRCCGMAGRLNHLLSLLSVCG